MRIILRGRRSGLLWSFIVCIFGFVMLGYLVYKVPSLPSASTATPTALVMPDVAQLIQSYRDAERAVLQTLSPDVLNQLPVFAHGSALDELIKQVDTLKAADQYQTLQIEQLQIIQATSEGATINVLTNEVHTLATYPRTPEGAAPLQQDKVKLEIVYQLIYDAERWKVEKIVVTKQSVP